MRAPVCEARGKADAVFIGRAISGTTLVHFDVERAFKGVSVGPTSVSSGDGTCALTFTPGERYLVYAYRHPSGGLATHLCTRTRALSDPRSAADLAVLEAQSTGHLAPGFLAGAVFDVATRGPDGGPMARGVAGVRITVTAGNGSAPIATSTRFDGSYRVTDVPPGRFTVTADLPATLEPVAPVEGEMTSASCAEVDFVVSARRRP